LTRSVCFATAWPQSVQELGAVDDEARLGDRSRGGPQRGGDGGRRAASAGRSGDPVAIGRYPGEHHHHLVCDDCGKVEAFVDDELERVLDDLEAQTGYTIAGHDVVLRGICDTCTPSRAASRRSHF
jgi:hypothetical protein